MVKSVNFLNKSIFDYLGKENSAILLSQTGFFLDRELADGVLWVQYDENEKITAVISGDNQKCVVFTNENADFEELSFLINGTVITSNKMPYKTLDKKYLMHICLDNTVGEKGIKYTHFDKIQNLNPKITRSNTEIKKFLNLSGCCEGAVIEDKLRTVSGGFICFNGDLAFISDVFTKEKYRGKGYGKALVKKLLTISPRKDVYLISRDYNVGFYEKLGFEVVKKIYEYATEDK